MTVANFSTIQLGTYDFIHDQFSLTLDLNDRSTYFVDEIQLPSPSREAVSSFNVRTPGEPVYRHTYKNRVITITLAIQAASIGALDTAIDNLLTAVEGNLPTTPYYLKMIRPNGAMTKYSTVLTVEHDLPVDSKAYLAKAQGGKKRITIKFTCYPYSFTSRVWLANQTMNAGFEAPSGPAVTVFDEDGNPFANANAYVVQGGSTPTVASQVMTITSGTRVAFGSPAWGAINQWTIRWQYATGLTATFYPHLTDASNYLSCAITGSSITLATTVAGVAHNVATSAPTLTNGNWYWFQFTQFPSVADNAPYLTVNLYNDSTGTIGTAVANGAVAGASFDAVTALVGRPNIRADSASLLVGGNFAGVHTVKLFGPGGWQMVNVTNTAHPAFAWDTTWGNPTVSSPTTYPNGPVTSFGAARIDATPTGAWNAYWSTYQGSAPAGTPAIPVQTAGNVMALSVWYKTSGCGASLAGNIYLTEYDASGNFLRQTAVGSAISNVTSWTQLSGTVTTGASCAYVGILLNPQDATSGSANGTVWFDNVQCWDTTRTGVASGSMPYCELVFPQSPAQLLVSGLKGNVPSPMLALIGGFVPSGENATDLYVQLGRRAVSTSTMRLVDTSFGDQTDSIFVSRTFVLDSASYGGCYATYGAAGGLDFFSPLAVTAKDGIGVYHVLCRLWSNDTTPSSLTLNNDVLVQINDPFFGLNRTQEYQGPTIQNPALTASTWAVLDTGLMTLPPAMPVRVTDTAQITLKPMIFGATTDGKGNITFRSSFIAFLPTDAETASLTAVSLSGHQFTSAWNWFFVDGLNGAVTAFYDGLQRAPLFNFAIGLGTSGPNSLTTVQNIGDVRLQVDPTGGAGGLKGVNQWLLSYRDDLATGMQNTTEFIYQPQYLYPL